VDSGHDIADSSPLRYSGRSKPTKHALYAGCHVIGHRAGRGWSQRRKRDQRRAQACTQTKRGGGAFYAARCKSNMKRPPTINDLQWSRLAMSVF